MVEVLRKAGLEVIAMVSIFNYGFAIAEEAFAEAKVSFTSLSNYETLIGIAVEKKLVSAETEQLLLEWRKNPAEWMVE